MRILALDVGNTSVAAARFAGRPQGDAPDFVAHRVRGASEREEIDHWRAVALAQQPDHVVVGSVHRFGAALVDALRAGLAVKVDHFERGDAFPLRADVAEPARVGVDRLAAAFAAHVLARGPALVVSAGTAITVDWIDHGPLFRGGAIVPGRRLQARALHTWTDRLPEIAPASDAPLLHLPGKSTEEAIGRGLDVGIPGLVDALLEDLERASGPLPVFVTGGDAIWLAARLKKRARREAFLAARGLALAVLPEPPA